MVLRTFNISKPGASPIISKMWQLVITGVLVHLLLLSAVFDIYFVSPIYRGMTPHKAEDVALANRVVLFVADGLRADSLYNDDMAKRAPFLKAIKSDASSWGISHTQVPTESRPGHIAMLAGFNEDPSAITKGWKYNPVDFDSVINQSKNAWAWGSPDIVDMFNRDNLSHIHLDSYDPYMQDFSGHKVPIDLDAWVFEKVTDFLQNPRKRNWTDVNANGNIFFLHLLGLDTAGHSFKPQSEKYNATLEHADKGIEKMVKLFDEYFEDNKTAYIFTADHGMTNWGSHGDGSAHETEVPFIAWGSGIASSDVSLDLEQLNIAALISALIGINFPINSLGVVPMNYLNASLLEQAHIVKANMLQLYEQYLAKHFNMKANTVSWLFTPFTKLPEDYISGLLRRTGALMITNDFELVIAHCYKAITLMKEGLKYYDSYYQTTLLTFVTVGFVGWIIYLFISIQKLNTQEYNTCRRKSEIYSKNLFNIHGGVLAAILVICISPFASSLPANYYMYAVFPIFTWCMVINNYKNGMVSFAMMLTFSKKDLIILVLTYLYQLELLMATFFHNIYLTLLLVNMAYQEIVKKYYQCSLWIVGLIVVSFCPLVTTLQSAFSVRNQVVALLLWISYGYLLSKKLHWTHGKQVVLSQLCLLYIAFINSILVDYFELHNYYVEWTQGVSWAILATTFVYPFLISTNMQMRLISCCIALITPYTLMSVGFESVFMFFFLQLMLRWLRTEHQAKKLPFITIVPLGQYNTMKTSNIPFTDVDTVRRTFSLLIFIILSLFGTGNFASISSFDPMWTRCFLTVFSPFTMTALILIKLIVPFLIVMCTFRAVMIVTEAQMRNTFLIILLFCDLMVLQFLYLVKNEGSWLEIGMSLSRFIIVNVTTIVLLLLYQLVLFLTTKRLPQFFFNWMVLLRLLDNSDEKDLPHVYTHGNQYIRAHEHAHYT